MSTDDTPTDSDVSSVLAAYKSEGDPALYEKTYSELKKFVEGSLDIYKVDQVSDVFSTVFSLSLSSLQ